MAWTTSDADLEILLTDGATWLPLVLAPTLGQDGAPVPGAPKTISEALAASDHDVELSKRLIGVNVETFYGGAGVDYNDAPGVYTRTPGYACPAGYGGTDIAVSAIGASQSRIVAFAVYGGSLWAAQRGTGVANTARVMVSAGGTGGFANSLLLGVNEFIYDMVVADDGAGNPVLWASSATSAGLSGRMHKWDGAVWTSTNGPNEVGPDEFGTNGRKQMAVVTWETGSPAVSSQRIVAISGYNTLAYTDPSSDPMVAANWSDSGVPGLEIGTSAPLGLRELVAARQHVWALAGDGVFDVTSDGRCPNLLSDDSYQPQTGFAGMYLNEYLYHTFGYGTNRIWVGESGLLQEEPGQCGPTWFTPAESEYAGPPTCFVNDQNHVVAACYNMISGKTGLWWGIDKRGKGVETPNPLIWWGPEVFSSAQRFVTAMKIMTTADGLRLFIASNVDAAPNDNPVVTSVPLPVAGSPIADLMSSGQFRFALGNGTDRWNPTSSIQGLPITLGETASKKHLHQHTISSRGPLSSTTKLQFKTRADANPGATTWTTTTDVTASPTQDITPATVVSGNRLEWLVNFVSPAGATAPPDLRVGVLDAVRMTMWRIAPSVGVRTIPVAYGDGVLTRSNAELLPELDPDTITGYLEALTRFGRTTLRDRQDKRWTVKLEQVLDRDERLAGGRWGKTVRAQLEVTVLAQL